MIVEKEAPVPNSLSLPSRASFAVKIESRSDIREADRFAKSMGLPLLVIGCGTNIIPREYIRGIVGKLDFGGIRFLEEGMMQVAAGETWDGAVGEAVARGLSGIEALSAIPGTAGAAPVQNIGAYGSELADRLVEIEAYDRHNNEFIKLKKDDCGFGYRDSIFKKEPGRFIISSISLKLSGAKPKMPQYKDVIRYFEEKGREQPSVQEIREAIIEIRARKLPDIRKTPNAGSYFVNPVVRGQKIFAGKLIEEAGLKGAAIGKLAVFPQNALILTNPNGASFDELMSAEKYIIQKVLRSSGITLRREPVIIG